MSSEYQHVPPHGWAKLNTDVAATGNPDLARCGDLIRDKHGAWLAGFTRNIGSTTSFAAELWGLRDWLALCCNLNITSLIVELDAKSIVDIFQNPKYENNIISPILDDCKQLMMQFQHIQFKHCYQEANRCANMLARMGMDHDLCLVHYVCPPEDIRTILNEDCNGLFFNKTCTDIDVIS